MTLPKSLRAGKSVSRVAQSGHDDETLRVLSTESGGYDSLHDMVVGPSARTPAEGPLWERILASVARTHRFVAFEAALAKAVDVDLTRARALLASIDDPSAWAAGPRDGVRLLHFSGGPAVADAITGFVLIDAGTEFPEHKHEGDETVIVLQGAFEDDDGVIHVAGEQIDMAPGTGHRFKAVGNVATIQLAVIQKGVWMDGEFLDPSDPRA